MVPRGQCLFVTPLPSNPPRVMHKHNLLDINTFLSTRSESKNEDAYFILKVGNTNATMLLMSLMHVGLDFTL